MTCRAESARPTTQLFGAPCRIQVRMVAMSAAGSAGSPNGIDVVGKHGPAAAIFDIR